MAGRIDGRYETRYSEIIPGAFANHGIGHRFDHSPGGCIGVSSNEHGKWTDRVLLSPAQAKALVVFIGTRGRSTVKRAATKSRDAKRAK